MRLFVFLSLCLAGQGLFAQHTITGRVVEATTGTPLEQANVYFPQLQNGTVTDAGGNYRLANLPEGTYKLVVSLLGYASQTLNVTISTGTGTVDVSLEPSAIEMEEVIVSTPFHKLQRENVMKVEQAPMRELTRTGAPTLAEGIRQIAGVETVSTGVGIGKPVIRGLSSNRVLVYTQGVRLENQQFGDEHGLGISDAGIESVEVIKGPASLLYGSDALGGVLYLNPERYAPAGETRADIGARYLSGTLGYQGQAGAGVSGDKWRFLARVAGTSHADYKDGADNRVTNSRFGEWDFKTGVSFGSGRFKNDLRYNFNRTKPGIPEEIGSQDRERSPLLPYQDLRTHILSNSTEWFLPTSSFKLVLGYLVNDRLEYEEHHHEEEGEEEEEEHEEEEEGPALDMKLSTFNYNLQYQFALADKKLETILGVQGMWQENRNAGEEILIPDAVTADIGLMATSHLHFEKSDLQLGLRWDRRSIDSDPFGDPGDPERIAALDRSFNSFNVAAGYRMDLGSRVIGRLNIASGFRAPNLSELLSNGTHSGANRFEIGNPNLTNEKNLQTDLSLEYRGEHFELGLNGFYNSISDFIFIAPTGDFNGEDPVYQYEQQDANLYGGEAALHLHPHPLDWLHLQSNLALVFGKLDSGEYLPLIPPVNWRNTFRVEWGSLGEAVREGYAFVGLESHFRQARASEFETETPGYNLVHMGFGGQTQFLGKELQVRVAANNLFNTEYIAHLSRLKPDGILNIGRNITLGLTMVL